MTKNDKAIHYTTGKVTNFVQGHFILFIYCLERESVNTHVCEQEEVKRAKQVPNPVWSPMWGSI